MRTGLLVIVVLGAGLAGCAGPDHEPPSQAPEQRPFHYTIDWAEDLPFHSVRLVALQATQNATVEFTSALEVEHRGSGVTGMSILVWPKAPVEALQARAAGDLDAVVPARGPNGSGGGGCGGDVVRVSGVTLVDTRGTGCTGGGSAGSHSEVVLAAGEWLLLGMGTCGAEAAHITRAEGIASVSSNASLEMITLPPAPFVCDIDFDAHYDTSILGQRVGEASLRLETRYGTQFSMHDRGSSSGEWVIEGERIPFSSDPFWHHHSSQGGTVGFDVVADDNEFGTSWSILGI